MQDHTAESIKSLEGFRIAWIDEAQNLSARSLSLLRPTIRAERSELWASWNPRRKSDAIDDFFRAARAARRDRRQRQLARQSLVSGRARRRAPARSLALSRPLRPHLGRRLRERVRGRLFCADAVGGAERRAGSERSPPIRCCRCAPSSTSAAPAPRPTPSRSGSCSGWGKKFACSTITNAVGQVLAFHVNWLRSRGYRERDRLSAA